MKIREIVTTTVLILALIAISTTTAAAIACDCGDICVNETGWWNDGGAFNASATPKQAAVDNAISGDTICVAAESYTENVDIATANLTLRGEGAGAILLEEDFEHGGSAPSGWIVNDYVFGTVNWKFRDGSISSDPALAPTSAHGGSYNAIFSHGYQGYETRLVTPVIDFGSNTYNTKLTFWHAQGVWWSDQDELRIYYKTSASGTWNLLETYVSNQPNWIQRTISLPNPCSTYYIAFLGKANYGYGVCIDDVKVTSDNTDPPDPVNLANTTGGGYLDYWVNYTWSAGTGNITDSYNVLLNGTWTNGTEATFMNVSMSPCDWVNITVFAYNASYTGTLSERSVSDEVQAPCDVTPPVINITTPEPYGLYTVGMTLSFSATDGESGVATIVGNLTNTSGVSQNVVGNNSFAPAVGVYTLVVTATDNAGNINVSDPVFFVVYDPDGGHATGGGWFYPDENSTLPDGRANFGFTAKYKDSSSTGKLNFQYKDAGIHLKSTSIDWLTISSVSAQFQGTGTINGDGLYTFRVKAKDNGEPGADTDHFDIKIWNGTDTEADPYHKAKNTISGGNIQVHTN